MDVYSNKGMCQREFGAYRKEGTDMSQSIYPRRVRRHESQSERAYQRGEEVGIRLHMNRSLVKNRLADFIEP